MKDGQIANSHQAVLSALVAYDSYKLAHCSGLFGASLPGATSTGASRRKTERESEAVVVGWLARMLGNTPRQG